MTMWPPTTSTESSAPAVAARGRTSRTPCGSSAARLVAPSGGTRAREQDGENEDGGAQQRRGAGERAEAEPAGKCGGQEQGDGDEDADPGADPARAQLEAVEARRVGPDERDDDEDDQQGEEEERHEQQRGEE